MKPVTYDGRGNMKCDPSRGPSGTCYTHDSENRLTSFTDGDGVQGFYTYDAMGRRVSKTFNGTYADVSFAHAGDMEIAEYDSQGRLLRRFVPGPRTDIRAAMIEYDPATGVETARYGYLTNRLGSVVAVVDAAGTVTDKYIYTPFGVEAPLDASGNPFRYTGRKLDPETGLYYYRARYYDPGHGRFLETDPVFYEDQMNLYAYVHNDPVNMTDPDGKIAVGIKLEFVFVVANFGGRFDTGFGYDTEKGTAFAFESSGGNLDPTNTSDVNGLQLGAGVSGFAVDSSGSLVSDSVSTDVDLGVASSGVITDEAIVNGDGTVRQPEPGEIRGGSAGAGLGAGVSQVRTEGSLVEKKVLPSRDEWDEFVENICGDDCNG